MLPPFIVLARLKDTNGIHASIKIHDQSCTLSSNVNHADRLGMIWTFRDIDLGRIMIKDRVVVEDICYRQNMPNYKGIYNDMMKLLC